MSKAKILTHEERIALTQGKFFVKPKAKVGTQHFDECPKCHARTLIHESGCEHCTSCGYDACAWNALE